MNFKKIISLVLSIAMIFSLLSVSALAAPVAQDYELVGNNVVVDGSEDKSVDVAFVSVGGGSYYCVQADWSTKETNNSSYLKLDTLTPGASVSATENSPSTGRVVWSDTTLSNPIAVDAGAAIWTGTYTVNKNTPTGEYTVSLYVTTLTDGSYDSTELGQYTATISVTNSSGGTEPTTHSHCICGTGTCTANGHTHSSVEWKEWTSTTSLPIDAGNYYLSDNVAISSTWSPANGTALCLNGFKVTLSSTSGSVVEVGSEVNFTLSDCQSNGSITSNSSTRNNLGGGVFVNGVLNMYGGTITGIKANYGAGVYLNISSSVLNMYGGTISNNEALDGGGVKN